jgi:hypothetical protein
MNIIVRFIDREFKTVINFVASVFIASLSYEELHLFLYLVVPPCSVDVQLASSLCTKAY